MRRTTARKGRTPRFRSDQEERAFWMRHNVEEFADSLQDLDATVRPALGPERSPEHTVASNLLLGESRGKRKAARRRQIRRSV